MLVLGCICGGVCEVALTISLVTLFGWSVGKIKAFIHRIRCKCSCHEHVCEKGSDEKVVSSRTHGHDIE